MIVFILCLLFMLLIGVFCWLFDSVLSAVLVALIFTVLIAFGIFGYKQGNRYQNCLEMNYQIIPKIIHVEDNSKKFLKFNYNNQEYEIILRNKDNEFYLPESLLRIDPCNNKIFVKK